MKEEQYQPPTNTAQLVMCHRCKGKGRAALVTRALDDQKLAKEQLGICRQCDGIGKLWKDTRLSTIHLPRPATWVEILFLGIAFLTSVAAYFMGFISAIAFLVIFMLLLCFVGMRIEQKGKAHEVNQTFYTRVEKETQKRGSLMQQ